jgi:hypothetical protein
MLGDGYRDGPDSLLAMIVEVGYAGIEITRHDDRQLREAT